MPPTPFPQTNTWRNADKLAKGRLGAILVERSAAGDSAERILLDLNHEFGISVNTATIRRWVKLLVEAAA